MTSLRTPDSWLTLAASVAALLSGKVRFEPDTKVVAVLSGGNVDLDRLRTFL